MQIRVSTKVLSNCSERLAKLAGEVDAYSAKIKALSTKLQNAWDGKSAAEARNNLSSLQINLNSFSSELTQSAKELAKTARAFEQAEGITKSSYLLACGFRQWNFVPFVLPPLNGVVRVIPEELRNVAQSCRTVSEEIRGLADTYKGIVSDLQTSWEGNAAKLFFGQSQEVLPNFAYFSDSIVSFAEGIVQAAAKYEEIDSMFSSADANVASTVASAVAAASK